MNAYTKERLSRVFAPIVVGVPPANAFRELAALPDGTIRHYGHRLVGGVKRPVYAESDDFGFTWRERPLPAGHPSFRAGAQRPTALATSISSRWPRNRTVRACLSAQ